MHNFNNIRQEIKKYLLHFVHNDLQTCTAVIDTVSSLKANTNIVI